MPKREIIDPGRIATCSAASCSTALSSTDHRRALRRSAREPGQSWDALRACSCAAPFFPVSGFAAERVPLRQPASRAAQGSFLRGRSVKVLASWRHARPRSGWLAPDHRPRHFIDPGYANVNQTGFRQQSSRFILSPVKRHSRQHLVEDNVVHVCERE